MVLSGTCAHVTATLASLSGLRPCGPSYMVKDIELARKREVTILSGKQRKNWVACDFQFCIFAVLKVFHSVPVLL